MKEILSLSGSASAVRGVEAAAEVTEEIVIMTGDPQETQGPRPLDAGAHPVEPNITGDPRRGVNLIRMFPEAEIRDAKMIDGTGQLLSGCLSPAHHQDPERLQGIKDVVMTNDPDHDDAVTLPVDPQHQCVVCLAGMEGEEIEDVVIERDPLSCQNLLAHVPLEEIGEDVLLLFHLIAVPRRPDPRTFGGDVHLLLYRDHALVH